MTALSFPLERIQPIISLLQRYSRLLTTGFVLSFVIRHAISNYHTYLAMGPGGLSYNVYGWLGALCCKPFARETLSTEQYDQDGNKECFLDRGEIKKRRGDHPKMSWHVFPSRQLDRFTPLGMHQRLIAFFDVLAMANQDLVSVPSRFERIHPALVINESLTTPHAPAEKAPREICHIHRDKDFSFQVTMSPQDCKTVIEKACWGERHPLSGSRFLRKEYVLLYALHD